MTLILFAPFVTPYQHLWSKYPVSTKYLLHGFSCTKKGHHVSYHVTRKILKRLLNIRKNPCLLINMNTIWFSASLITHLLTFGCLKLSIHLLLVFCSLFNNQRLMLDWLNDLINTKTRLLLYVVSLIFVKDDTVVLKFWDCH